jgi:hypothetical protein
VGERRERRERSVGERRERREGSVGERRERERREGKSLKIPKGVLRNCKSNNDTYNTIDKTN